MNPSRNGETEFDPRERFALYRLCDCPTCEGKGKAPDTKRPKVRHWANLVRCPDCRGEGRIRQEVATCESPEAVGVALVTLAREEEWEECPIGLLDRMPECEACEGHGDIWTNWHPTPVQCGVCHGSGVKPTGTWLLKPWLPSARNVSDAARTLAKSKRT